MAAASSDPISESLQRLQPELDAFNNSLSELCRANSNKPETLALRNDLQEYYSKLHKDLLSRYEILKQKDRNQNAVEKVPKIEPEMKQPRKEDEEKKEAMNVIDDFGGYSIPKVLPTIVCRRLFAFCKGVNGKGLLKYVISNRQDHVLLRDQLPAALGMVSQGAQAVVNAIKGYDFSESGSRLNDEKESVKRRACICLLECLFPVLGSNENAPVAKGIQERAREVAKMWREKMGFEKSLESASKLDIQVFLQLLVTFRIGKDFGQDELCEMLLQIVSLRESPALALFLGLSPKMPDFVDKLSKNGKSIEAIRYAHAFGIMDKVKLTDLLKAYLEDTEKAVKDIVKKGGGVPSSLLNSAMTEIDAINTVIKVVKEYNLEDMFPLDDLQNKLKRLQKVKEIRMGTGEHNFSMRNKVNKKAAASTPEKKMMVTTVEKKAAEAKSDKKSDAKEKERLKRPRSSEPLKAIVELRGTQGPADLGLNRLSQRVKYDSEWEMNSTARDKEKVPHNAGLFQSNHAIYRDDHNLSSYQGDSRSALQPSMYGSGHPGTFVTPSTTVTQANERRVSDGYPSASGYSNIKGPADLGLNRLSQRVKYDSEWEMNSTARDKEKVPHNAGLFQSNHAIYRDDHNLTSYQGDSRSALQPSMYGSGHPGTFVTPSTTVTQANERRVSDGYPSASGYSNINPVGPSYYETRAMAGALAVSSAQINYDVRGLQNYTPTFGGVDKSSFGSSTYNIGAVANSSSSLVKNNYERGPESNVSTLGGDNLSNVSSSMYGSNWSSDPNNWNGRRGLDQYKLKLGADNTHSRNSSVYDSGASAVPSTNLYGSGLEQKISGYGNTTSNHGSVASAAGVSGQSAINRYQFNSG
ncbi:hypothetical protein SUGI_0795840 [Cryptomeria japonica]|uniref:uncharacterized protein LOC131027183 n=1 Tax=Cryptomeria japonica TaxID=3369 RepID=UPI0024148E3C|nr:uncharacterized protein LOC131027183 [Cryptomeria japonica]GLJ39039.1 hypothetical protein SUGI_0795840 [Cryptomeria japonica]